MRTQLPPTADGRRSSHDCANTTDWLMDVVVDLEAVSREKPPGAIQEAIGELASGLVRRVQALWDAGTEARPP